MDITDKFLEICIFLAHNRFITILKQMPMTLVTAIKADSIAGKKPSHHRGKGNNPRSKQKMGVVGDKHPRLTAGLRLREDFCQAIEEILSIPVGYEYLSTLSPGS